MSFQPPPPPPPPVGAPQSVPSFSFFSCALRGRPAAADSPRSPQPTRHARRSPPRRAKLAEKRLADSKVTEAQLNRRLEAYHTAEGSRRKEAGTIRKHVLVMENQSAATVKGLKEMMEALKREKKRSHVAEDRIRESQVETESIQSQLERMAVQNWAAVNRGQELSHELLSVRGALESLGGDFTACGLPPLPHSSPWGNKPLPCLLCACVLALRCLSLSIILPPCGVSACDCRSRLSRLSELVGRAGGWAGFEATPPCRAANTTAAH